MGSSANTATIVSHQLFWAHGSAYENSGGCNASFLHWLTLEQLSLEEVVTPSLDTMEPSLRNSKCVTQNSLARSNINGSNRVFQAFVLGRVVVP